MATNQHKTVEDASDKEEENLRRLQKTLIDIVSKMKKTKTKKLDTALTT